MLGLKYRITAVVANFIKFNTNAFNVKYKKYINFKSVKLKILTLSNIFSQYSFFVYKPLLKYKIKKYAANIAQ